MEISFLNKTILVTGAGLGIGKQICKQLYKCKARVIAVSKNQKELDELQEECNCNIQKICVDISDWKKTRQELRCVRNLDGLVNNAGIAIVKPFVELSEKDYDDQFKVNFKGAFNVTQFLVPQMKNGCSVVNISSIASLHAVHGHALYSATKSALDSLTRTITLELASKKVRANSINPTVVLTNLAKELWKNNKKGADDLKARILLNRFGEVTDVADLVLFLLSEKSSFISGICVPLDGGLYTW